MKKWKSILSGILAASFAGCAARPAYFGDAARTVQENGTVYWEAPALAPAYLQARMRRRRRAPAREAAVYDGTLNLRSSAPAALRSTFILTEGSSVTLHFALNSAGAPARYEPEALDVVVACARGACRADSKPLPILPDGRVDVKAKRARRPEKRASVRTAADAAALAAGDAVRKDAVCAALDDALTRSRTRVERSGGSETPEERSARGRYALEGCASWLDERGGVGAARRRVRLSQWTSLRGD